MEDSSIQFFKEAGLIRRRRDTGHKYRNAVGCFLMHKTRKKEKKKKKKKLLLSASGLSRRTMFFSVPEEQRCRSFTATVHTSASPLSASTKGGARSLPATSVQLSRSIRKPTTTHLFQTRAIVGAFTHTTGQSQTLMMLFNRHPCHSVEMPANGSYIREGDKVTRPLPWQGSNVFTLVSQPISFQIENSSPASICSAPGQNEDE